MKQGQMLLHIQTLKRLCLKCKQPHTLYLSGNTYVLHMLSSAETMLLQDLGFYE